MLSVWLSIVLLIIVYKLVDFVLRLPGDRLWATRRCILVTGCGSGFGQQFVSRCAARKCTVFAACRTAESVTALKLKAAHQNGDIKPFVMDVTSEQSVLDGFNYVCRNLPPGGRYIHRKYYYKLYMPKHKFNNHFADTSDKYTRTMSK